MIQPPLITNPHIAAIKTMGLKKMGSVLVVATVTHHRNPTPTMALPQLTTSTLTMAHDPHASTTEANQASNVVASMLI